MSTENTIKRDDIILHDCVIIDFIHCQLWQILDFADGTIKLFSRLKIFQFLFWLRSSFQVRVRLPKTHLQYRWGLSNELATSQYLNLLWPKSKCRRYGKLDMSTARRRLKSLQSLYGTSTHPTMVTHRSQSWSWMIDSHPFHSMSISKAISNFDLETTRSRS